MSKFGNSFIFHEKYAPQTIEDTILPKQLKSDFQNIVKQGDFTHLLFSGSHGIGKTTLAKALCNDLGLDFIYINASLENGIDVLRTRIMEFASTVSLMGAGKAVILDEADGLGEPIQRALRGFMDEFSVRFIMTCNFPHRIIEPLKDSRVSHYDFNIPEADKNGMMRSMYARIVDILTAENITFEPDAVKALVRTNFPNFRKTLMDLQKYSLSGNIDIGILGMSSDVLLNDLIELLKKKNFNGVRTWVSDNVNINKDKLFLDLYKHSSDYLKTSSIPQLVLSLADYGYKSTFAVSQEINTMALLTDIMASCDFKD